MPCSTNRLKPIGGVICAISTTTTMKMPNQMMSMPACRIIGSTTAMVSTTEEMPSRKQPMIRQAGIDFIWFGIFIVVVVEMAQITPPIGFNLFVMQGMTKHQMGYIARSALPLFLLMVVMVFILIAVPELATWLPENMREAPGG